MEYNETFLGFTQGDPNGIGVELFVRAFELDTLLKHCSPVLYSSKSIVEFYLDHLGIELSINYVKKASEFKYGAINVFNLDFGDFSVDMGKPNKESGKVAFESLKRGVEGIKNGEVHNVVTLPIDKHVIHSEEFAFAGHTDYLAEEFDVDRYMMILASDELRVGVVTGHIPITEVSKALSQDLIKSKIETLIQSLKFDFAVRKPKIAVLGLNPHSGDQGLIGKEEIELIQPAIKEFVDQGELVYGPYPADGFFGNKAYLQFDAVLAMYHDQGLIPFKQLAFHDGVNYTAGLPIVRTSPDHGTANGLVGKGEASVNSLVNAVFAVKNIYKNRIEYNELNQNPLEFKSHRREKFSIGVPNLS